MDKKKVITTLSIALLLVALVGATYAYFIAQAGGTTSRGVNVTSSTTDLLTFEIEDDIEITANMMNFSQGAGNVFGETTATATLRANNYTHEASGKYNLFIDIESNPFVYSGNHDETIAYEYSLAFDTDKPWACIERDGSVSAVYSSFAQCEDQEYGVNGEDYNCVNVYTINFDDINNNQSKLDLLFNLLRKYQYIEVLSCEEGRSNINYFIEKLNNFQKSQVVFLSNYSSLCNEEINVTSNSNTQVSIRQFFKPNSCYEILNGNTYCGENYNDLSDLDDDLINELLSLDYIRESELHNNTYSSIVENYYGYSSFESVFTSLIKNSFITETVDFLQRFEDTYYLEESTPITGLVQGDAELLLQVTPPTGVTLTSIPGLEYVTVEDGLGNEISGYDITTKEGLIKIADNLSIEVTASNQSGIIEHEWTIRIIFVNLDQNQNLNTGKEIRATINMTKIPKTILYTGYAYRNNEINSMNSAPIIPNDSIYCPVDEENSYNGCDDDWSFLDEDSCLNTIQSMINEGDAEVGQFTCELYKNVYCETNGDENSCDAAWFYVTQNACEDNIDSMVNDGEWENGEFECVLTSISDLNIGGIGEYLTSIDDYIASTEADVYCEANNNESICNHGISFETLAECENDIDERVNNGDWYEGTFTCALETRTVPYFLKHNVVDNIIESTETCLYFNDNEFCMEQNYWIENDSDGSATREKLHDEMEEALGIEADLCDSSTIDVHCEYFPYICTARSNGSVYCSLSNNHNGCIIDSEGYSYCY